MGSVSRFPNSINVCTSIRTNFCTSAFWVDRTYWSVWLPQCELTPYIYINILGPGGQKYYHHAATQQSTYIRPGPAVIQQPIVSPAPTKKKEKPVAKTLIPGTDWLRVRTTEGNIFYSNKTTKQSLWTVPPEISEAVVQLEKDENTKLEEARKVAAAAEKRGLEQDEFDEVQRVKADVRELVKRRAEDGASESHATKKIKLVGGGEEEEEEDSDDSDDGDGDEEGEEEDWERGAAEQLAEEARIEQKKREEEAQEQKEREVAADKIRQEKAKTIFNVPDRVDLSLDEGKALFKVRVRTSRLLYTNWDSIDPPPREGYQPAFAMGYCSTTLRQRSPLCSATFCNYSSRSFRRVLS